MVKAAGFLFGLVLGRPWPSSTGLLNGDHEVVEGAAFGYADRWMREMPDAAWQVVELHCRRCLDRLCDHYRCCYCCYQYRHCRGPFAPSP
jgi:hypothetical protein